MRCKRITFQKICAFFLALALLPALSACSGEKKAAVSDPVDLTAGHKVAARKDSASDRRLTTLHDSGRDFELSLADTEEACKEQLDAGTVDAVLTDSLTRVRLYPEDAYTVTWEDEEQSEYAVLLGPDQESLSVSLSLTLDNLFLDGDLSALAQDYFGADVVEGTRNISTAPDIPEPQGLLSPGKLKVGIDPNRGFSSQDESGAPQGFDPELAKRIGERLNLEVELVPVSGDDLLAGLDKGEFDCVVTSIPLTERIRARYLVTAPYLVGRSVMVAPK